MRIKVYAHLRIFSSSCILFTETKFTELLIHKFKVVEIPNRRTIKTNVITNLLDRSAQYAFFSWTIAKWLGECRSVLDDQSDH